MTLQTCIDICDKLEEIYEGLQDWWHYDKEQIKASVKYWFQFQINSTNVDLPSHPDYRNHPNHKNSFPIADCITCNNYHHYILAESIYDQCDGDIVVFKKKCHEYETGLTDTIVECDNTDKPVKDQ